MGEAIDDGFTNVAMDSIMGKELSWQEIYNRFGKSNALLTAKNGDSMLLEFKCPHARKPVHVEVPGDSEAVKSNWTREIRVRCPHCRAVHWFSYRTGYIEAALSQRSQAPAARDGSSA